MKLNARQVTTIIHYGIEWLEGSECDKDYKNGALESIAHLGACLVTQHLTNEGTPTSDIYDLIHDEPNVDVLLARIKKYVKETKEFYDTLTAEEISAHR